MAMSRMFVQYLGFDDAGFAVYRWRAAEDAGTGAQGSLDALSAALDGAALTLLLAGQDVVLTELQLSRAEQRHFQELAPFELEERLLVAPDAVHVARGKTRGAACLVAYTDRQALAAQLEAFTAAGIELADCVALPLQLPRHDEGWSLALDGDQVHILYDADRFVSVSVALAPRVLQQLLDSRPPPLRLDLYAEDPAALQVLDELLDASPAALGTCQRERHPPAALWSRLVAPAALPLDLLQGSFARRLPLQRWWQQGHTAAALLALAFLAWTGLQWLQVRLLDAQYREVEARINAVYREVMPEGVLVNAQQQLAAQLARLEGGHGDGVLVLLSQLAPLLAESAALHITRLDYNAPRGELQLSLSAERNADILAFTDALQAQGLEAQAQGFSRQGQAQLANVLIRELTP